MAWSVNDTISETVFMCLVDAEQIDVTYNFIDAGALTMNKLQFYNTLASGQSIEASAQMLASKLNNQFTQLYLAHYQNGEDQNRCLTAMVGVLTDEDKTVEEFSNTVASCYNFS